MHNSLLKPFIFLFTFLCSSHLIAQQPPNNPIPWTKNHSASSNEDIQNIEDDRRALFYENELHWENPTLFLNSILQTNASVSVTPLSGQHLISLNAFAMYKDQLYLYLLKKEIV